MSADVTSISESRLVTGVSPVSSRRTVVLPVSRIFEDRGLGRATATLDRVKGYELLRAWVRWLEYAREAPPNEVVVSLAEAVEAAEVVEAAAGAALSRRILRTCCARARTGSGA